MPLDSGRILKKLPRSNEYRVAYSGGIDSHVLLFLLARIRDQLPGELIAVYVDHGIQQQSGDWEIHCRATCAELGVRFQSIRVEGRSRRGESPEAAARAARYRGLAAGLPRDAILLTAQHRDDQAETLLLQLFRGAGVRGLASMPEQMPFGQGRLVRPLLSSSRQEIVACARQHRLHWVEDPSNTELHYDRNFVRRQLLPQLLERWPSIAVTLSRAASHQADQLELAAVVATQDHQLCLDRHPLRLKLDQTRLLSAARQRNLLRFWIEHNGYPLPSSAVVERILQETLHCRSDASPLVHWPGAEIRRYRNSLYLMAPLPSHDAAQIIPWKPDAALQLKHAGGELTSSGKPGEGLIVEASAAELSIRFRQGGERLQPAGRGQRHALKKLLQEWQVPPWERSRIPLIYIGGTLVAVAGLCIADGFLAAADETGRVLHWSRCTTW